MHVQRNIEMKVCTFVIVNCIFVIVYPVHVSCLDQPKSVSAAFVPPLNTHTHTHCLATCGFMYVIPASLQSPNLQGWSAGMSGN
jgi:hypothetical protein